MIKYNLFLKTNFYNNRNKQLKEIKVLILLKKYTSNYLNYHKILRNEIKKVKIDLNH